MTEARRVIMVGALSTIATHAARLLAAEGAQLALLARSEQRLAVLAQDLRVRGATQVITRALDLESDGEAATELAAAAAALGGADVIAIFHGYLGEQARADSEEAELRRIISANFTSPSAWALAGANLLAAQKRPATLLGVSSVAGDRGRRSNYVYGAAKSGFSVLMQGLAHRLAATPFNIKARVIKFGFVDSAMTAHLDKGGPLWASPELAGRCVVDAISRGGPVIYAPWFWRWIMLIIRFLPAPIFNRINL